MCRTVRGPAAARRMSPPMPGGMREPFGADRPQSPRRDPIARDARTIARGQFAEQLIRRHRDAVRRKIGRRIVGVARMMRAVDADAGDRRASCRRRSPPSIRMPANFAPSSSRSFGHLSFELAARAPAPLGDRIVHRQRHHEATVRGRCAGRRRHRSAAGSHRDCPAPTPRHRPRRPRPAVCARRRDPQRPALAARAPRQRLGVGRAERLVGDQANARSARLGMKMHQNSDLRRGVAAVDQRRRIDEEQYLEQRR